MVSLSSVLNIPPVANATLSTQPVAVVDRVSTRVTPVAVSAPVASDRISDNNAQRDVRQVASRFAAEVNVSQGTAKAATQDSSAYLTQVISQSQSVNASLASAQAFSRFAPALQYNTLVSYSFVKYKPSNAGIPSSDGSAPPPASAGEGFSATAVANEYQAYNQAQSRAASLETPKTVPVVISG